MHAWCGGGGDVNGGNGVVAGCGRVVGGLIRFIINVPGVFPLVWKGVKPWLDVKTTAKIKIFAKVGGANHHDNTTAARMLSGNQGRLVADLFLWVVDAALWLCAYQPSEWQPVLSAAIDADQLPVEYGGTGPPLCERDHSHDVIVDVDDQPPLASPGTSLSSTMATAHDKVGRQTDRERREGGGGAIANAHYDQNS